MEKITLSTPGGGNIYSQLDDNNSLPQGGFSDFQSIIRWGTTVLILGAVILSLVFLIWGGIDWITSGGSQEKLTAARKKITYSVIGLIISLGAFMIINIIGELFGITFFQIP